MVYLMLVLGGLLILFVSIFLPNSSLTILVLVAVVYLYLLTGLYISKQNPAPQEDIEPLLSPTLSDKLASRELKARLFIGEVILLSMFFYIDFE